MSISKFTLTLGLALLLSACGSSVKLNSAAVDDRSNGSADANAANALGSRSAVPQVDAGAASSLGLASAARLVYFDYDSYTVKAEYQSIVENNAKVLKGNKSLKAMIEGHTDDRGGREYNLALGQKRAEAVRRALTLLGVPDSQLEAVSYGEEKPAASGSNETAWASNRRAEISYR